MKTITPQNDSLLSNNILASPPSFIREILKSAAHPQQISFAGGLPDPALFPQKELERESAKIFSNAAHFQYHITEGYFPLREKIKQLYYTSNPNVSAENILITTGAQQALDLCGKVFLNPGDKIGMENPSYPGAIQAFSAYLPEIISFDMDGEGIIPSQLQKILSEEKLKFIYLTPTFQNPTGIRYSSKRRLEIAEICRRYNTLLIEDTPYSELYYDHQASENIGSSYAHTIQIGTFSKQLAPGLRTGWVTIPPIYYSSFVAGKQANDLHSTTFTQALIESLLQTFDLSFQLEKTRALYRNKRDCMSESLKTYLPDEVYFDTPDGGMFFWIKLPPYLSSEKLLRLSAREGVLFVPGDVFETQKGSVSNFLRLNFTHAPLDKIEKGIQVLGKCIYKQLIHI